MVTPQPQVNFGGSSRFSPNLWVFVWDSMAFGETATANILPLANTNCRKELPVSELCVMIVKTLRNLETAAVLFNLYSIPLNRPKPDFV
jgi:hypothetical protein